LQLIEPAKAVPTSVGLEIAMEAFTKATNVLGLNAINKLTFRRKDHFNKFNNSFKYI